MKALILAAGLGTRLAPITNDRPKSLVPVNGKPVLLKQIENLHEIGVTDITVVSGYKAEVLESAVHVLYPEICIVKSKYYAKTNNMYSAYLGIKKMYHGSRVQPFFMMNADVFFDASVLAALKDNQYPNLIVTDIGQYNDESMKVAEKDGRLVEISKEIMKKDALGCSIDVYKFGADGGQAFYNQCVIYIEEKCELKFWSEVALNDILKEIRFEACPLAGRWTEIDNHADLAAAEKLFGG